MTSCASITWPISITASRSKPPNGERLSSPLPAGIWIGSSSLQFERRVNQDNAARITLYRLRRCASVLPLRAAPVTVHQHLDGTWSITRGTADAGTLHPGRHACRKPQTRGEIPSLLNFTSGKNRRMGDENTEPRASMMSAAIPELADRLKRFATMVTTNRVAAG